MAISFYPLFKINNTEPLIFVKRSNEENIPIYDVRFLRFKPKRKIICIK